VKEKIVANMGEDYPSLSYFKGDNWTYLVSNSAMSRKGI